MATLTIPYSFVNGTTAVAAEVNGNFSAVKSFCEALAAGTNIDAGAITAGALASTCCLLAHTRQRHYGGFQVVTCCSGTWLLVTVTKLCWVRRCLDNG
jgi:hypothetical protein